MQPHSQPTPVFIGGCPRSGTTLLGAILGTNSDILTVPESQFKLDVFRELGGTKEGLNINTAIKKIDSHWRFDGWGIESAERVFNNPSIQESYSTLVYLLVEQYGKEKGKSKFSHWVDHTPNNIKNLQTLFSFYPNALAIHIVRDGRAVAASVKELDWGPNTVYKAGQWWSEQIAYGLAAENKWGNDRILRVKFEDIVENSGKVIEDICAFIGVSYEEQMVTGNGFQVPKYSTVQHSLVGKVPDRKRINHWKEALLRREVEMFEFITGDMLSYLGYEPTYGIMAKPPSLREKVKFEMEEYYKRFFWNLIKSYLRRSRL